MTIIYPAEKKPNLVKELQSFLRYHGYSNIIIDGIYGKQTLFAARAFQSTHLSPNGQCLNAVGIIDQPTWETLAECSPTINTTPSLLQILALRFANNERGILESPLRSNSGPRVNQYLKSVGCPPGHPWCAAFIYWCFQQAANEICSINPLPPTAHCLTHWIKSQGHRIPSTDALPVRLPSSDARPVHLPSPDALPVLNPSPFGGGSGWGSLIKPGTIFFINHGSGRGHTGIITTVEGNIITTIEGNTNDDHSREGIGVFQLSRNISEINTGFINYG